MFDGQGKLIQNGAERHAFNTTTAMREPDGRVAIVGGARCQARQLAAERAQRQDRAGADRTGCGVCRQPCTTAAQPRSLPEIQRAGCR